jgi:hypothetical protein
MMSGYLLSVAVLTVSLPTILHAQRGGITNNLVWELTYLVPIIVGLYYARPRRKRKQP